MTNAQFNRTVARATGECLRTIQRRGFSPMKLRARRLPESKPAPASPLSPGGPQRLALA